MYNKNIYITKNIKINRRIKILVITFCVITIIASFLIFGFYGFSRGSEAIKFVSSYKDVKNRRIEKVMINPTMRFEQREGVIYDIKAKKAMHVNEDDMTMIDVSVKGSMGDIKAGKLLVTNNGDRLHFSDKPFLVIRQIK